MKLIHLWDLLEKAEQSCLEELRGLRSARPNLPDLKDALDYREATLLKELDQLHRVCSTTRMSHAVVTVTPGGMA